MSFRSIFSASSRHARKLNLGRALQGGGGTLGPKVHNVLEGGEDVRAISTATAGRALSEKHTALLQPPFKAHFSREAYLPEQPYASNVMEYNQVMLQFVRWRRAFMLRDAYEDMLMDGIAPNRDTFHIAIPGCMRAQRLQDAFFFFNEMKANGMMPDVTLYNCMISTCGRCIQMDKAFQVAEEMESMGISPKLRTFVALLSACGTAGRVNEANGVVQRMTVYGLSMNKYCYSALITAYKNRRPVLPDTHSKIFELLEQSSAQAGPGEGGPSEGEGEDDAEAEEEQRHLLGLGLALGRRGSASRDLVVHHAAIRAMVDLRNYEGALKVVDMIEKDNKRADGFAYAQLVKAHLMVGRLDKAMDAFENYLSTTTVPSLDLYVTFIEGAILKYSVEGMAMAKRLLMELDQRGFFLNPRFGGHLLSLAARDFRGDFAVASLVFDLIVKHQNQYPPYAATMAFLRGLLARNTPETDPRVVAARKLVNHPNTDRRSYFGKREGGEREGGREGGTEGGESLNPMVGEGERDGVGEGVGEGVGVGEGEVQGEGEVREGEAATQYTQ